MLHISNQANSRLCSFVVVCCARCSHLAGVPLVWPQFGAPRGGTVASGEGGLGWWGWTFRHHLVVINILSRPILRGHSSHTLASRCFPRHLRACSLVCKSRLSQWGGVGYCPSSSVPSRAHHFMLVYVTRSEWKPLPFLPMTTFPVSFAWKATAKASLSRRLLNPTVCSRFTLIQVIYFIQSENTFVLFFYHILYIMLSFCWFVN